MKSSPLSLESVEAYLELQADLSVKNAERFTAYLKRLCASDNFQSAYLFEVRNEKVFRVADSVGHTPLTAPDDCIQESFDKEAFKCATDVSNGLPYFPIVQESGFEALTSGHSYYALGLSRDNQSLGFLLLVNAKTTKTDKTVKTGKKTPSHLLRNIMVNIETALYIDHLSRARARQEIELEYMRQGFETFALLAEHDIQAPIRKIKQSAEFINMEPAEDLSEDTHFFLGALNDSADSLGYLIASLIQFSTEVAKPVQRENTALADVVTPILNALFVKYSPSETHIQKERMDVFAFKNVQADTDSLKALLYALLDNSFKFSDKDSLSSIHIITRYTDHHAHIDIIDAGIGIDGHSSSDVFKAFTRLNDKRLYPGIGLGLTKARRICEKHGWTLDYDRGRKTGTHMCISLPLQDVQA